MHKIEVIVQPDRLSDVSEALRRAKIGRFLASDVTVFNLAGTPDGSFRGARYTMGCECVKVELVVAEHEVEPTVGAIRKGIGTVGGIDTHLIVLPVEGSVRRSP